MIPSAISVEVKYVGISVILYGSESLMTDVRTELYITSLSP